MFIFCLWIENGLLYSGVANQHYLAYFSCICLLCEILQAGLVIYNMTVDDDLINYGIENQPFSADSSVYLSNFLSLRSLKIAILIRFHSNHSRFVHISGLLFPLFVLFSFFPYFE